MLTFTAKYMPTEKISVNVGETCNLSDVHDLSLRIARACLNTDADVVFARKLGERADNHPNRRGIINSREASPA